ncbi:MAG TPA: P-type DNA transfer protein VirB5 [Methylibium sp.]|uniref:P-type DNA transfer protein VirB5 n=1 Tax=Methylibium sp. TaxID=2067992 RepID=UPI002DB653C0|nr:P-type DNA transfer protein VirB5 [Methylibium sp.]HEU4458821.1 P-type DNA transfer protein VirB5 [Methylibium sp.]
MHKSLFSFVFAVLVGLAPMHARAGIPVIDVTAVANLIQQIAYWQQQIQGMTNQLNQLRSQYAAITGGRGMEALVPMTNAARNYLPPDYQQLMDVLNGTSSAYAGLSGQIQSALNANAVLSNASLASLSPEQRRILEDGRRSAALAQTMSRSAYQNTSQRFAVLQQLVTAIGSAGDAKAIADLQGRIGAEQAMLSNEQNKLAQLAQVMQADQLAQAQRRRELAIQGIGDIDALRPVRY